LANVSPARFPFCGEVKKIWNNSAQKVNRADGIIIDTIVITCFPNVFNKYVVSYFKKWKIDWILKRSTGGGAPGWELETNNATLTSGRRDLSCTLHRWILHA
jgi:hypothetical protein